MEKGDIQKTVKKWEKDEPQYSKLALTIFPILKNSLTDLEFLPEVSYRIKDLLSIIRKIKKKQRTGKYKYEDLTDKLGFRIICSFIDEMEAIDKFILSNFNVKKVDNKKELLEHNRLDYISNHYDVSIQTTNAKFKKALRFSHLVFEIQVKTINQHAWSSTSHALSYKQDAKLSEASKRRIFRLLSLYEIADDEFASVNNSLRNDKENIVYDLLKKTEGKIYKYGKVDFDREMSLHVLNILLTYFNKSEIAAIKKNIESFIASNEKKIQRIFADNRKRFHELTFITQPEIFIIWFALENFSFSIEDNWNNNFEQDELEEIKTLWGEQI